MSDEEVGAAGPENGAGQSRRISPFGLALAGVAALLFVGGTLLSLLSAGDDEPEQQKPRPTIEALMEGDPVVVRGTALTVERLGEPRDAGVVATIGVGQVISGELDASETVVYDKGFRESWGEGQDMILFLGDRADLPSDADFRVEERCIQGDGALPCPYEVADIERLAQ